MGGVARRAGRGGSEGGSEGTDDSGSETEALLYRATRVGRNGREDPQCGRRTRGVGARGRRCEVRCRTFARSIHEDAGRAGTRRGAVRAVGRTRIQGREDLATYNIARVDI